ncbi:hypothetical protein MP638_001161 [Amoeboaphelidium occidentale]|nr:hypothetical protein MP638_001161 [Amoeboaphelidium occidentale]
MALEAATSAAAATNTISIWVKYRSYDPVDFILPASANVSALLDSVIAHPRVGFGEYKGPIDIYENEDGQPLRPGLQVSSIRATTEYTPLIVKIPSSDHSVTISIIWFSIALVFMVVGLGLINNTEERLKTAGWGIGSTGAGMVVIFLGLYYKQYKFARRGTEAIIGYFKRCGCGRVAQPDREAEELELATRVDDGVATEPQNTE